ncbi:hypothetical protein TMatcc_005061 [Talaromyces marneffei ATCC 18224]
MHIHGSPCFLTVVQASQVNSEDIRRPTVGCGSKHFKEASILRFTLSAAPLHRVTLYSVFYIYRTPVGVRRLCTPAHLSHALN